MTFKEPRTPKLYQLLLTIGLLSLFHSSYSIYEAYKLKALDPSTAIELGLDIKLELLISYIITTISLLLIYTNLKPINFSEKFKGLSIDEVENVGFDFNVFVNKRSELKI